MVFKKRNIDSNLSIGDIENISSSKISLRRSSRLSINSSLSPSESLISLSSDVICLDDVDDNTLDSCSKSVSPISVILTSDDDVNTSSTYKNLSSKREITSSKKSTHAKKKCDSKNALTKQNKDKEVGKEEECKNTSKPKRKTQSFQSKLKRKLDTNSSVDSVVIKKPKDEEKKTTISGKISLKKKDHEENIDSKSKKESSRSKKKDEKTASKNDKSANLNVSKLEDDVANVSSSRKIALKKTKDEENAKMNLKKKSVSKKKADKRKPTDDKNTDENYNQKEVYTPEKSKKRKSQKQMKTVDSSSIAVHEPSNHDDNDKYLIELLFKRKLPDDRIDASQSSSNSIQGENEPANKSSYMSDSKLEDDGESDSMDDDDDWEAVEDNLNIENEDLSSQVPKEDVEIILKKSTPILNKMDKETKRAKWMRTYLQRKVNKLKRENRLNLHKVHLLCLIAGGFRWNGLCNNKSLHELCISILPAEWNESMLKLRSLKEMNLFLHWFSRTIRIDPDAEKAIVNKENMINNFETEKASSISEIIIMFVTILRALGLDARIVLSLQPLDFKLKTKGKETDETTSKKSKKSKKQQNTKGKSEKKEKDEKDSLENSPVIKKPKVKSSFQSKPSSFWTDSKSNAKLRRSQTKCLNNEPSTSSCDDDKINVLIITEDNALEISSGEEYEPEIIHRSPIPYVKPEPKKVLKTEKQVVDIWAEVYVENEEQYVCFDCINKVVGNPKKIAGAASSNMAYVISYDMSDKIKDVSARYVTSWLTVHKKIRGDHDWFKRTIKYYEPLSNDRNEAENLSLTAQLLQQPFPVSINEFKNHPLYALERHLLKYQAIYPTSTEPLGYTKNREAVYPRNRVKSLHTRQTWLKEALMVRLGEEPYKAVKALNSWKYKDTNVEPPKSELFGRWQCEPYIPPIASEGIVPRNEYGNIEVFQSSMVPTGCVHLKDCPGIQTVAKKLDIDAVNAVVGFDSHSHGSHPVYDGVVVCEEFADVLLAAYEEQQQIKRQKEIDKQQKRVWGNWKTLIRGLFIKEKMKKKFNLTESVEVQQPSSDDTQTPIESVISWPQNRVNESSSTVAMSEMKFQFDTEEL